MVAYSTCFQGVKNFTCEFVYDQYPSFGAFGLVAKKSSIIPKIPNWMEVDKLGIISIIKLCYGEC